MSLRCGINFSYCMKYKCYKLDCPRNPATAPHKGYLAKNIYGGREDAKSTMGIGKMWNNRLTQSLIYNDLRQEHTEFTMPLFNSVGKKLFLGRKNTGGAFARHKVRPCWALFYKSSPHIQAPFLWKNFISYFQTCISNWPIPFKFSRCSHFWVPQCMLHAMMFL
jgi:hypothetical protein